MREESMGPTLPLASMRSSSKSGASFEDCPTGVTAIIHSKVACGASDVYFLIRRAFQPGSWVEQRAPLRRDPGFPAFPQVPGSAAHGQLGGSAGPGWAMGGPGGL